MDAEKSALENGTQNGGNGTTAPPIFTSPPTSPRSVRTAPPVRHRTRRARRRQTHDVEAQNAALQRRRSNATGSSSSSSSTEDELEDMEAAFKNIIPTKEGLTRFYSRFTRRGKKKIGIWESAKNMVMSSWLNLFVIFIPLAWVSHWHWADPVTFVLCFLALVPLEWLFDWGGEQLAHYCGKNLGDLIIITLNNSIEATLAIVLLNKCKLRLMQSTVVGVVILHLLLIPGVAFVTGGARIMHQELHAHSTELNHSLLTVGVLSLLLPAAFFAALDNGATKQLTASPATYVSSYVTDETRSVFLRMSRGMAVILLVIYISSRVYLHNPPGDGNALELDEHAPEALKHEEKELEEKDPKANQYFLITVLAVAIGIMAATTEWLVESIEFVAEDPNLKEEWFGMILLPIVSFAANGFVAVVYFFRYLFRQWFKSKPEPPAELARARAIDLSIQFTLFWMPFFILLAWWIDRPLSLLFDFFEIAVLLGACFLVNYVTADSKTNWAEGIIMVAFYVMIALCAWFYDGQPDIKVLAGPEGCNNGKVPSVADTILFWNETLHAAESGGVVEHAAEGAKELLKRLVGYD